jgi:hypothetical protein
MRYQTIVLAALLSLSTACREVEATDTHTFAQAATVRVFATTFNGRVDATPSDDGLVHASVLKRARALSFSDAEDDLHLIDVSFSADAGTVTVTAQAQADVSPDELGVDITVAVPDGLALNFQTSNGSITSDANSSDVSVTTSNGDIDLEAGEGTLNAQTSNGAITIHPSGPAAVEAHTSNGAIDFAGTIADGSTAFVTSNGAITLALPASSSFSLSASTSNGSIACDFPINSAAQGSQDVLDGQVGSGGPEITAQTTNGSIQIDRL